jgi:SAM-dependent methyltransferase
MPPSAPARVRQFYDRSTPSFARFGQGGRTGAIHRAVWGPGVTGRDQAFHFVDHQIAEHIHELSSPGQQLHVVDLGCGIGGTLCYLAERLPVRATGVTLSPVQAAHASVRTARAGYAHRVTCLVGDYCNLPPEIETADLAYAIESFVHGPDPRRFFAECRRLIRPGGRLIVCDDFLRLTDAPEAGTVIERFREGWHVHSLITTDEICATAQEAGFSHRSTLDLTPLLELERPRDWVIKAFLTTFGWLPLDRTRFGHLAGGDALQTGLRRGWLGYDLLVFERSDDEARAGDEPATLVPADVDHP